MEEYRNVKIFAIFLGILLPLFLLNFLFNLSAWSGPTGTPPTGNVSDLLDVTSSTQFKNGSLGLGGYLEALTVRFTPNDSVGTTCNASTYGTMWYRNDGHKEKRELVVCAITGNGDYVWKSMESFDKGCYIQQGSNTGDIPWADQHNFVTECPSFTSWSLISSNPIEIWKDNVTELYWTQVISLSILWNNARTGCIARTDLGLDWRLPTKDELMQVAPAAHSFPYKPGHGVYFLSGDIGLTNSNFWAINGRSRHDVTNSKWLVRLREGLITTMYDTVANCYLCVARDN